jgi:hypothetical protein
MPTASLPFIVFSTNCRSRHLEIRNNRSQTSLGIVVKLTEFCSHFLLKTRLFPFSDETHCLFRQHIGG